MSSADPTFPWATLIAAAGGVVGVVGTLVAAKITNRAAAERERRAEQHEDRIRFHKERLEIYASFLKASRMCRATSYKSLTLMHRNQDTVTDADRAFVQRFLNLSSELTEASEMVALVASPSVKEVADAVYEKAHAIIRLNFDTTPVQLNERNSELAATEERFRKVAREELIGGTGPTPG